LEGVGCLLHEAFVEAMVNWAVCPAITSVIVTFTMLLLLPVLFG
jgi:hypothetical protein